MGSKMAERVKKSRKSDNIISKISILLFSPVKSTQKTIGQLSCHPSEGEERGERRGKTLARVRAARAFQQRC